jgi:hypothetical protein
VSETVSLRNCRDRNTGPAGKQRFPCSRQAKPMLIANRGNVEKRMKVIVQGALGHAAVLDKLGHGNRPADRLPHELNGLLYVVRDGRVAARQSVRIGVDRQYHCQ